MRENGAIYGGEMSAHHYFRDFAYCDSGMIPWLIVLELMSKTNLPLSKLINERLKLFQSSGERNYKVVDANKSLKKVEKVYKNLGIIDKTDGISFSFPTWRFNLRKSNTESLIRLNVEANTAAENLENRINEIIRNIE